ncbi:MAG: hypothetical protein R3325_08035 [Thermoanaerobaculia bacterium]|nr:hypothetical protein [Thermoanaerobaculia bacterium]
MRRTTRTTIGALTAGLLAALALAPGATAATTSRDWCGTYENGVIESLAIHYENQRRLERRRDGLPEAFRAASATSRPKVVADGDLALMEDDGSLIITEKLFDLDNRGLRLKSKKKTPDVYKIGGLGARLGTNLGELLPLDDDDSILVALPFPFTFYGVEYDSMWVNSDGNITFDRPDRSSFARDLARVLNGPPRIAPFFEDYNPAAFRAAEGATAAAADAPGVYVRFPSNKKAIVTWYRVPRFGQENENTFQVEISKNRQIKFRYGRVDGTVGIVGIAPGGGSPLATVDFSEDRGDQYDSAIAERFADSVSVDEPAVAKAFYSVFEDDYSHLVVFTDFPIILGSLGTIAFERNISNAIDGIGLSRFDAGPIYGSKRPLESFVMMGQLGKYERNVFQKQFLSDLFAPIHILLHEVGHRWLFFASIRQGGLVPDQLRGRGDAHWSFYTHSVGSLLEGSFIEPDDDGPNFRTTDAPRIFSPFDLYLMGALSADEVPATFTVTGSDTDKDSRAPEPGQVLVGTAVDVPIDSLVRAEGPRKPDADDAPRTIKMAIILLSREGETPSSQSLAHLEDFRVELEREFRRLTDRRLRVDTTLVPRSAP